MSERSAGEGEFVTRMRQLQARLDADWPEQHPGTHIVEYYRDRAGRPVGYVRHFSGKNDYILIEA